MFVSTAESSIVCPRTTELEFMVTVKFQLPQGDGHANGEAPGVPTADILSVLGQII